MILTRELVNKNRTALRRIEAEAHRYAEALCNGDVHRPRYFYKEIDTQKGDEKLEEEYERHLLSRVAVALSYDMPVGEEIDGLFLNLDPRGYALKVKPEFAGDLHTDWGGYGILAPDEKD